ncbi:aminodeoxychorismate/anthranilate synthase component II [bacterium]|nr:aminodeoxychorismate/anthranilate synthase component II [bacterium]
MFLVIDNYDSYTFNLVHAFAELGMSESEIKVIKNDELSLAEIIELAPKRLLISPGPCTPKESGVCLEVVRYFIGRIPILGVCLGHQIIGQVCGGRIVRDTHPLHGKTVEIMHNQKSIFRGLPSPLLMTRYNSLLVDPNTLPEELEVLAVSRPTDPSPVQGPSLRPIMALRHKIHQSVIGIQFHPESITSEQGSQLFQAFISL